MKRIALVLVVFLVATSGLAQVRVSTQPPKDEVSHGGFAQLLLKALATKNPPDLGPAVALEKAKQLDLLPTHWTSSDMLTQAEMADVLHRLCPEARYQPSDPQAGLSQAFTETLLRRHLPCIESYRGTVLGHGMTDEEEQHPVSPSNF